MDTSIRAFIVLLILMLPLLGTVSTTPDRISHVTATPLDERADRGFPALNPAMLLPASPVTPEPFSLEYSTLPLMESQNAGATFDIAWVASCATPPPDAVTALDYAAGLWGTWISSTVPIAVNACWATNLGGSVLGTGIPIRYIRNFPNAPQVDTDYPSALANALSGSDLHPEFNDIGLEFNANLTWSFATTPSGSGTDFVSVALHELAHGLGFIGNMYVDSQYKVGWCGVGPPDYYGPCPTPYDRLVVDSDAIPLLDYQTNRFALAARLLGDANSGGPNTRVANAGTAAKLYTPPAWQPGSSLSHLDPATFGAGANHLMSPIYTIAARHPGPVTLAIFQDMGWLRTDGVPNVTTTGPLVVGVAQPADFTGALFWPAYAGQPVTYTWSAAEHAPLVHPGQTLTDSATLDWSTAGEKAITVTVTDNNDIASALRRALVFDVGMNGPAQGDTNLAYTFQAQVTPGSAGLPITYTWEATEQSLVVHSTQNTTDSRACTWTHPGAKTVTVTAAIAGSAVQRVHTIQIEGIVFDQFIYLPLVQRQ
jgi:hypothetical protein